MTNPGANTSSTPIPPPAAAGILAGTPLLTRKGEVAAEALRPCDHLITRAGGFAEVQEARAVILRAPAVCITAGSLGHMRPGCDMILPAGQRVLIRDWRARALFGRHEALAEAARLVDGAFIRSLGEQDLGLVQLRLARPEVIYAGGMELECALPAGAALQTAA